MLHRPPGLGGQRLLRPGEEGGQVPVDGEAVTLGARDLLKEARPLPAQGDVVRLPLAHLRVAPHLGLDQVQVPAHRVHGPSRAAATIRAAHRPVSTTAVCTGWSESCWLRFHT
ncbi:hypothetical protein CKY47_04270 [Saccharothrix yanglingensis]|uniref:Uncharacterized protein n=1 Tax=Saccharothrix yanglingensis TaxID=659496 RepID=A0ABU0WTP3_9PSEU|nr:hypothetical protein [Saccharothrix yanglingensis]